MWTVWCGSRVSHPLTEQSGIPKYSPVYSPLPRHALWRHSSPPLKQDHRLSRFATGVTGLLLGATGEATWAARASRRYPPGRHGGRGWAASSTCPTGTRAELPWWRASRPSQVRLPSASATGTRCQAGRWHLLLPFPAVAGGARHHRRPGPNERWLAAHAVAQRCDTRSKGAPARLRRHGGGGPHGRGWCRRRWNRGPDFLLRQIQFPFNCSGYKDQRGVIWSVVDAVAAGARAFSEVRPGARALTRRRRASPPAEIGTASLVPCFSACKVPAGPGTAWALCSSPAVAAITVSALGAWAEWGLLGGWQ